MTVVVDSAIDPIRFEILAHRLWAIGEEGRIALQRVTASPIVAQGGECMCSFYDADGNMILACSGHLRFAAATSDAIKRLIEWFDDEPGINEGDEFILNDPYVAGSHTYDIMQIAPIFWEGKRVAWVASSSHTADTGGVLRGAATEIYHEGIRLLGLKIVEAGAFREDVFKTITEQCRDPEYVGMDIRSRTAANNVCRAGYLELLTRFGADFVEAAGRRLIEDSSRMAREKLTAIPNGTWRSRIYGTYRDPMTRRAVPYQVLCAATKAGDQLTLDFTGSSGQLENDQNSTLPSTMAHIMIALTNRLFWDLPWSDGKMDPVRVIMPERSVLNCAFPAACGRSPRVGQYVVEAVSQCVSSMLFAAGEREDINAGWGSFWYLGGPGYFYGGHNAQGLPNPQGLYDTHGGGLGATPLRDGVPSGGQQNIPSGGISDIERIELQYPFLYLSRSHNIDGGGPGAQTGGAGTQRLLIAYGSQDLTVDFTPYGGLPHGAWGLFGGHPTGTGGTRSLLAPAADVSGRLGRGDYPVTADEAVASGWAELTVPAGNPGRIPVAEGSLLADFTQGGGGYGDPLERAEASVVEDLRNGLVSVEQAGRIFGVVVDGSRTLDPTATAQRREEIRLLRVNGARTVAPAHGDSEWATRVRFHEYLEAGAYGAGRDVVRCMECGTVLCDATQNYKQHVVRRELSLGELAGRRLPGDGEYIGALVEYACPTCAVLLAADISCPEVSGEDDLWDIQLVS
ncbi:MAG: N-methylhydantoinase [Pseudonocardiales bacterium]|nr:N-methylhydantoinase [Pseudonocardiales bacterium]